MRSIRLIAILTLSLIIVIKLTFPEQNKNEELTKQFWFSKTFAPNNFDVVVCGDSRIYRDISISELVAPISPKVTGINLGYSGAGLSDDFLNFAISKFNPNSKNKILIIGVTPHALTLEAFKNEDLYAHQDLGQFEKFRYKYLSGFLKHFAPYKPMELIKSENQNYQEEYMDGGWVASYYIEPDSTYALKSYANTFSKYQVAPEAVTSFINSIEKITATGIKVIAFRPPTTVTMRKLEDSISGFNEKSIKQALIDNSVIWLDFNDADFESYDGSHLEQNSAKKLSKIIGAKVNQISLSSE